MSHLNEEQLVLYYYGEEDGRRQAEAHLAECAACRQQLESLKLVLDAVEAPPVPERGEQYGAEVWDRIRAHLPEREQPGPWQRMWQPRLWAAGAAVAALILAAFLVGRFYPRPPVQPVVAQQPTQQQIRERVLLVAVGDHLEHSQMLLVELTHAPESGGAVDISNEQRRAQELVASNRLYRQTAENVGDTNLANVLDELERTLIDIAHQPAQVNGAEMEQIRQRIEKQGILFKVRVVGTAVRARQQKQNQKPHPAAGPNPGGRTT
ncbi:MAG TPA: zf-HC2 domain-containing protein [Terriglobales bacterium]|jgi:hypothetical protein|nr:zf-HC2 domain-containing protein [Terriglobales bacterium]